MSAWISVTMMRAPDAPIGWPSAQAPPFTLTLSCDTPSSFMSAMGTTAKASLTSHRSTSSTVQPALASAFWVAPTMWNTGFASEAVRALIAANPLASQTIFASVFQDNPGSARVLTNAGFDYLGDAEAFSVARGAKVATWTYLKRLA